MPRVLAMDARYRVLGEIGRGGMGVVYEAVRCQTGERVAIKTLASRREGLLRFNVVQRAIGMESASNFRQDVRRHSDFREALATHDIAEAQVPGDNRRGFLKPSFD